MGIDSPAGNCSIKLAGRVFLTIGKQKYLRNAFVCDSGHTVGPLYDLYAIISFRNLQLFDIFVLLRVIQIAITRFSVNYSD